MLPEDMQQQGGLAGLARSGEHHGWKLGRRLLDDRLHRTFEVGQAR